MYEEHEDGSFTLHMCEWYEQGRRLVGEYETLGDGSGFAVTDEWSTCSKIVVNHPLTRPDGTVMPGISRLRRFDWKVGPDEGCTPTTTRSGAGTARTSRTRPVRRRAAIPGRRWVTGNPSSADSRATGRRLRMAMMVALMSQGGLRISRRERGRCRQGNGHLQKH